MKFYPCVLLLFLFSFFATTLSAQTISVTNFDNTLQYSPGSSIAVPFHVDYTSSCISQNNTYTLYLSATSNFATKTAINTTPVTGFYATYINGTIPSGLSAGIYYLRVEASAPHVISTNTVSVTVVAGTAIQAGIDATSPLGTGVYGTCNPNPNSPYQFNYEDNSTGGTLSNISFFNEISSQSDGTLTASNGQFIPQQDNYTVIVKASNGTTYGTKAYSIINNATAINLESSSLSASACLPSGSNTPAVLTYMINVASLQNNFPGDTYQVNWGDGTPASVYTICDIVSANGAINHSYYNSSCGQPNDVFAVVIQPKSPYCTISTTVSSTATISTPPVNIIDGPANHAACSNTPISFSSANSDPGKDPNSPSGTCNTFTGARYYWYVKVQGDNTNTPVAQSPVAGLSISTPFTPTLPAGQYTAVLHYINNPATVCPVTDATFDFCVQDKPIANFEFLSVPANNTICNTTTLNVHNSSILGNTPCSPPVYNWSVTGPGTFNLTNLHSAEPQFNFTTPGTYTITLSMPDVCGGASSKIATIKVDGPPTADLTTAQANFCGPQTITYTSSATSATNQQVTYGGTAPGASPTYTWSVSPNTASFVSGTTLNSQYPQINFPSVGDYTVSVTQTNSCGTSAASSQIVSIKQAPTVTASASNPTVCVGAPISLTGNVTTTNTYTIQWTDNAAGGTFNDNTSLTPIYTPLAGKTGNITLTLHVITSSLPSPCNDVSIDVPVTIAPPSTGITNTTPDQVCDGETLSHAITSSGGTADSYTWTVTQATNVTGANGQSIQISSATISDHLTLIDHTTNGQVVYHITPYNSNGCPGTAFDYKVTVNPLPVINPLTNADLCSNIAVSTVLQPTANLTGTKYTWTAAASSVNVTGYSNNTTNPAAAFPNNEKLVNTGTIDETVTYTITPISTSGCTGAPVLVIITVHPQPTQADADNLSVNNTEEICNQPSFQLNSNIPSVGTGKWTQPAGQTAVFTNDTDPNTIVSNLQGGNTYSFTWTITSACGSSTPSTVTVTDYPTSVGGTTSATTPVCTNNSDDVSLSGYTGNIVYWQTSTDGGNTWITVNNITNVFHYNNITATTQFRAVIQSGNCSTATSSITTVTVTQTSITNNIVTNNGAGEICNGNTPGLLSGSAPQGGDGINYTYQWQQSTDGTTFTDITSGNSFSNADYQAGSLTQTTYFRRAVSSGICTGITSSYSNIIMITVDPVIQADFTAQVTSGCAPFTIDQNDISVSGTAPGLTYTWYANTGSGDVLIASSSSSSVFPGYQIFNDNQSVTIKLTVKNALGCEDSKSVIFSTVANIMPSFTMSTGNSGCADQTTNKLTVNFTNTSTPAAGGFTWDFGDGTSFHQNSSTDPVSHDFTPATDGADKIYIIKLTPDGCSLTSSTQQITVYPASPVAIIDPGYLTSCAPYNLTIVNKSPGTNDHYDFYLTNISTGATMQQTTTDAGAAVSFNLNTTVTTQYNLHMVATNKCGVTGSTFTYQITVNPSTVTAHFSISPSQTNGNIVGCVPFQTSFHNLSTGGETYTYRIYDNNLNQIDNIDIDNTNASDASYAFTTPGNYYVSVAVNVAGGSCAAGVESDKIPVTVLGLPTPAFTSDANTGCSSVAVNFTNTTPDQPNEPAASYTYVWDFGDGTTSNDFTPAAHTFDYHNSPYTVTLTATNDNGCAGQTSQTITVSPPPDFTVMPGNIINIPNYTFSFTDQTVPAPQSWLWDFGDTKHTTSTLQNPEFTYPDVGKYIVTLTTTTAAGCISSVTQTVQITGIPGQLYVPNAFMPSSLKDELRVFTLKGSGIKQWNMRVYNNWGQVIFETTKLSSKGEPVEFWDGKYKGQDVPQGGYQWQISATFLNGTDWKGMSYKAGAAPKKSGIVNLIR